MNKEKFESLEKKELIPITNSLNKIEKNTYLKYKKHKFWKKFTIINLILLTFILIVIFFSFKIYKSMETDIKEAIQVGYDKVDSITVDTFHTRYNSVLLDKDGNVLKEFKSKDYIYKTYKEINPLVLKATIAIEDERFYKHNGIDFKSLTRAVYYTVVKGQTQGGSTITTQLSKNIFLSDIMTQKSIYRKISEWVISQELEKKYSKNEILEYYVNNINYGNGCYSIESAADFYFQKNTNELSLSQIALLVGIPNNPSIYNPITKLDNVVNRRNIILDKMYELKMINKKEYNQAKKEEITLNLKESYIDNSVIGYAETFAMHKSTEELMKLNGFLMKYTFKDDDERDWYKNEYNKIYQESYEQLINGGYQIQTSIDQTRQQQLQDIINSSMTRYTQTDESGKYIKQVGATVIDNQTGLVLAIVGGRTQDGINNSFNRAFLSARQPGSTIKPIVSYVPAIEKLGIYAESILNDKYIENGPKNAYSGYQGEMTTRNAVEISVNTIPFSLLTQLTPQVGLNYLTNMHFSSITAHDYESPITAVGGFTKGVTPTEMANAYSTLANNGKFEETTNIQKITKISNLSIIYENKHSKITVYNEGAAYLMTNILTGVLTAEHGTAYGYALSYPFQAGKTGTTNENKDAWMCGYTPYYSMAVWVGDDMPSEQGYIPESKSIWHDYMELIHTDLPQKGWVIPENVYTDENGSLRIKIDTRLDDAKKERNRLENERKLNELSEQQVRLSDLDYRLIYGLTKEEEMKREKLVEKLLETLETLELTKIEQVNSLKELYQQIDVAIENVKRKSAYDILLSKYNTLRKTLDKTLAKLEAEIEKQKQLDEAKSKVNNYIEELKNYVVLSSYRTTEQQQIQTIIDNTTKKMQNAISINELDSLIWSAKQSIDNFKTDTQLTQLENEELANKKTNTISELNNLVSEINYTPENWIKIKNILQSYTTQINSVNYYKDLSLIDTYKNQARDELLAVTRKTVEVIPPEIPPETTIPNENETIH